MYAFIFTTKLFQNELVSLIERKWDMLFIILKGQSDSKVLEFVLEYST